ncbi:MAG TPA: glycoside hydrolase family 3 C-terminal domain-containing protein, partial [Ktedonobacteraceae bacterium]|nr:glycoside hydrolase family 3 C-terminal domain-containing protein [Ktedonobacteraceae bacterium]
MHRVFALSGMRILYGLFLIVLLQLPISHVSARSVALWMNQSMSVDQRADQLLAQMTLDEKVALMHGVAGSAYSSTIPANTRLGIPALNLTDGPAGVADGMMGETAFPAPVAGAASWNPALMQQYGAALGSEVLGKGGNVSLAPTVNILRIPQWGRSFESLGEDPYLTSRMAVADIEGIQSQGVIATIKHYAANDQEYRRGEVSAQVDERTLHEIYLPAFAAAVQHGVGAVMCSYNRINTVYACEQPYLLSQVLKQQWRFPGFVMSDWGATHSTVAAARAGLDMQMPAGTFYGEALKTAVLHGQISMTELNEHVFRILRTMFAAGLFDRPATGSPDNNVASPADAYFARQEAEQGMVLLKNASHLLPLSGRQLRSIALIGPAADSAPKIVGDGSAVVNPPYIVTPLAGITRRSGRKIAIHYAQGLDSFDGIPIIAAPYLQPTAHSTAIHGLQVQFFNNMTLSGAPVLTRVDPTINFNWKGASPANGVAQTQWSARWQGTLTPPVDAAYTFSLTSDDGSRLYLDDRLVIDNWRNQSSTTENAMIRLKRGKRYSIRVEYYQNSGLSSMMLGWQFPGQVDPMITQAVNAARTSDVAVVFANDSEAESVDRSSLELPGRQDQLIEAVAQANPHTVVVLNTGGPVLMPWLAHVSALVESWYPGQEDGSAIAAVLFGDVNPSGKLPMTFPMHASDVPASTTAQYPGIDDQAQYSEGIFVGYRHYDAHNITPLFPFGYGLSYTTFSYSHLRISRSASLYAVDLDVTNSGTRAGGEVVQLYLGLPSTSVPEPPRQLKGFQKLFLQPGQSQHVRFLLQSGDL